jgi:hypothetical protein
MGSKRHPTYMFGNRILEIERETLSTFFLKINYILFNFFKHKLYFIQLFSKGPFGFAISKGAI